MSKNKRNAFIQPLGARQKQKTMRKLQLIIIFFVVGATTFGQSNIYHPFPDSNAMWTDRIYEPGCNMTDECSINQYTLTGDTLINGIIYKKLTQSGYIISQNYQYTYYSEYAGAIRQEINNKKVFYFPPYYYPQVDTLLYDFDLNVGDSLPLTYLYPWNFCNAVVDTIDSVAVGSSYHKRFHISTTNTYPEETWLIEGIGCSRGLFGFYCASWEYWKYLTCFIQNDTISYPTPPNSDCNLITFISELKNQPNSILIYPNPVKDRFTIDLSVILRNTYLSISNVNGQELIEQKIKDNKTELDISNLPTGVFILRIWNENILEIKRVIKK